MLSPKLNCNIVCLFSYLCIARVPPPPTHSLASWESEHDQIRAEVPLPEMPPVLPVNDRLLLIGREWAPPLVAPWDPAWLFEPPADNEEEDCSKDDLRPATDDDEGEWSSNDGLLPPLIEPTVVWGVCEKEWLGLEWLLPPESEGDDNEGNIGREGRLWSPGLIFPCDNTAVVFSWGASQNSWRHKNNIMSVYQFREWRC